VKFQKPPAEYKVQASKISTTRSVWTDIDSTHPEWNAQTRFFARKGKDSRVPAYQTMTDNCDATLIEDVDSVEKVLTKPPTPSTFPFCCCEHYEWNGGQAGGEVRITTRDGTRFEWNVASEDVAKCANAVEDAMEEAQNHAAEMSALSGL